LGKIHLVIPDPHAHPDHNNDRADWLGRLILDLKPDVVINLGDMFDMASMSGYDKGKKSFHGRSFRKDLDAGLDFDERIWAPLRQAKKRKPYSVYLEGNHENRLKKMLELQPELEGTVGFEDFGLKRNYHEIIEYEGQTPGTIEVDGVNYAHFFVSGVMGRPIGGEHPAYSLLTKQFVSCTAGHTHVLDFAERSTVNGKKIFGCVAGVYQDYNSDWAGEVNKIWTRGVVVKRNVEGGQYDFQWISIDALRKEYGNG
jgi:Calcineurin-like phosphoesterase